MWISSRFGIVVITAIILVHAVTGTVLNIDYHELLYSYDDDRMVMMRMGMTVTVDYVGVRIATVTQG